MKKLVNFCFLAAAIISVDYFYLRDQTSEFLIFNKLLQDYFTNENSLKMFKLISNILHPNLITIISVLMLVFSNNRRVSVPYFIFLISNVVLIINFKTVFTAPRPY